MTQTSSLSRRQIEQVGADGLAVLGLADADDGWPRRRTGFAEQQAPFVPVQRVGAGRAEHNRGAAEPGDIASDGVDGSIRQGTTWGCTGSPSRVKVSSAAVSASEVMASSKRYRIPGQRLAVRRVRQHPVDLGSAADMPSASSNRASARLGHAAMGFWPAAASIRAGPMPMKAKKTSRRADELKPKLVVLEPATHEQREAILALMQVFGVKVLV